MSEKANALIFLNNLVSNGGEWVVIEIIKIIIKIVTFVIFCLLSSYVLLFGKEKSGIKIDYAFASAILIGVMVILWDTQKKI